MGEWEGLKKGESGVEGKGAVLMVYMDIFGISEAFITEEVLCVFNPSVQVRSCNNANSLS